MDERQDTRQRIRLEKKREQMKTYEHKVQEDLSETIVDHEKLKQLVQEWGRESAEESCEMDSN